MTTRKKTPDSLRSQRWFGASDLRAFGHRSRTLQMGYRYEDFVGRPVIGIVNTWSDINPCHTHLRQRAEEVKRGACGRRAASPSNCRPCPWPRSW